MSTELQKVILLSPWGDLICPHCATHILTPDGMELQPGEGTCLVCRMPFALTPEMAAKANELARAAEQDAR